MKLYELGTFLFFVFAVPVFIYGVFTMERAADDNGLVKIEEVKKVVKKDLENPVYEYKVNE